MAGIAIVEANLKEQMRFPSGIHIVFSMVSDSG